MTIGLKLTGLLINCYRERLKTLRAEDPRRHLASRSLTSSVNGVNMISNSNSKHKVEQLKIKMLIPKAEEL